MKTARAVIGAAFGDEGKGLMTDFFAHADTTVCRFNGGAQAGHTVTMRDGRRHVFHHFGSGTFRGSSTYLSRFFISNPKVYMEEKAELEAIGLTMFVKADPNGLVTTPYDMMLNQMIEQQRGTARHGSVGLGINETIKRSEWAAFKLTVWDLHDAASLYDKLRDIREHWVPQRAAALNLTIGDDWRKIIYDDGILNHYAADAAAFYYSLDLLTISMVHDYHIVFEGAQGLCLDQDHRFFPYVTHASTGLKNIMAMVEDARIDQLDVTYVTRAYATRHGSGPFPCEVSGLKYVDHTNVPNDWQGTLRFGHLDLDLLGESIFNDLQHGQTDVALRPHIAITCINQVGRTVDYWHNNERHTVPTDLLPQRVEAAIGLPVQFVASDEISEGVASKGFFA